MRIISNVGFPCLRKKYCLPDKFEIVLSQWDADQEEVIASTTTMQVDGVPGPLFVVATYKNYEVETQPSAGRILVFAYENSQLNLLATIAIDGCPIAVTTINGLLAAAVNASVRKYHFTCGLSSQIILGATLPFEC